MTQFARQRAPNVCLIKEKFKTFVPTVNEIIMKQERE